MMFNTISSIGLILAVFGCYLVLTMIMPAVFFYKYIRKRRFVYRFALYQVTGNAWLLLWGFIFSFLNIWSPFLNLAVLIVLPLLAKLFIFRRDLILLLIDYARDKKAKVVTVRGTVRNLWRWLLSKLKGAKDRYLRDHWLEVIVLLGLFVFAVWYYGYFKINNFTYASSDEATHLFWVNSLFGGTPFPAGMYPHSLHFTMAGIFSISGIQTMVVNHFFSVTIMLMIHFMLYLTVREFFRSAAAGVGTVALFLIADLFTSQRYHNTLPMEYGFIAMFAMIIFLNEFMKKRDKLSMWMAAIATGWTFHTHFYITIFCVFIWIAFLIVYLKTLIRLKAILRTLLIIVISAAIAIAPFGAGLLFGQKFEQSVDWALDVMGIEVESEKIASSPLAVKNNEESSETGEEELEGFPDVTEAPEGSVDTDLQPAEKKRDHLTPQLDEFKEAKSVGDYLTCLEHLLTVNTVKDTEKAGIVYLLLAFAFLYGIWQLVRSHLSFRKKKQKLMEEGCSKQELRIEKQKHLVKNGLVIVVPLIALLGIFCACMSFLGLPALIDPIRASLILAPCLALLFAPPICFAEELLNLIPLKKKKIFEIILLVLVGCMIGVLYKKGSVRQLRFISSYAVTQELSNELAYDLIGTHAKDTWTVISPVNDLLGIHNYGFHYEIIDLLEAIEDGEKDIFMPTDDLYIIVEKKVMNADGVYYLPDYHKAVEEQSIRIRKGLIDENFYDLIPPSMPKEEIYSTLRRVTMSKLYYWMEEMKKAYPNEIEVYAEDDLCTVYHVRQSADFPINLSRDYRDKNYGVNAKKDFEKRYFRENGVVYEP